MEDQAGRDVIAVARRATHPLGYANAPPPTGVEGDPEDRELAIASVVCGMLVFVPLIPAAMSLTFGIRVLRRWRRLRPRDCAFALVGTALGAMNLAVSLVLLAGHFWD